jgi:hypothetical protein
MKFLIATPLTASQSGGPAQYTVCLKIALTKQGHSVEIISFQDVAQYPSGIRHFMLLMKVWARLRSIDTVIALDTVSVALPVVIAARLTRTKCIVRIGGDFLWEQYVERTKEKILLSEFYIKQPSLNFKEYFVLWLQKNIVLRMADLLVFSTSWQLKIWSKPYALTKRRTVIIENAYPSNYTPEEQVPYDTMDWSRYNT